MELTTKGSEVQWCWWWCVSYRSFPVLATFQAEQWFCYSSVPCGHVGLGTQRTGSPADRLHLCCVASLGPPFLPGPDSGVSSIQAPQSQWWLRIEGGSWLLRRKGAWQAKICILQTSPNSDSARVLWQASHYDKPPLASDKGSFTWPWESHITTSTPFPHLWNGRVSYH